MSPTIEDKIKMLDGSKQTQRVNTLHNMMNQEISSCKANAVIKLSFETAPAPYSVLHRML